LDPSTTLSLTVTLAVLAAAVTHATWNAIAHGIKDQTLAFALIGVGGVAVSIPLVIVAAFPRSSAWPYLLASVAIHVFYNLLLMQCYRLGEFSQVYPLARGISPLVVTILAAVFVHEHLAVRQVAGVGGRPGGLAYLVFAGRRPGSRTVAPQPRPPWCRPRWSARCRPRPGGPHGSACPGGRPPPTPPCGHAAPRTRGRPARPRR